MTDLYKAISLQQCADLISAVGHTTTVLAQGEMGIGKSSMLKMLQAKHPDHFVCYGDMTTKDVGDFLIPKIRTIDGTDRKSTRLNSSHSQQSRMPSSA